MKYEKISPLGPRNGVGTYETFFEAEKVTLETAIESKQYVAVDFVMGEDGRIYFEAYHAERPDEVRRECLSVQHFPFGIDIGDDWLADRMATELLHKDKLDNLTEG